MATVPKMPNTEVDDSATDKYLDELQGIQSKLEFVNEKASKEILEVEHRYNKQRKPLFEERSKVINNIPNFWQVALTNHADIRNEITDYDRDILSYLCNLDVQEFDDIKTGYRITLKFNENPYFTNELLEKQYHIADDGSPFIKATDIEWKSDQNTASKNNIAGKKRPRESFFQWFDENYNAHDSIGDIIKDELWANPVMYYMGEDDDDEESDEQFLDNEENDGDDQNIDGEDDGEAGEYA